MMEKSGKVQTNDYGVNVLVETEDSSNRHSSPLNFCVDCKKLSNKEIKTAFEKHAKVMSIDDMKEVLEKVEGFATSSCESESKKGKTPHGYDNLFSFVRVEYEYKDGRRTGKKTIIKLPKEKIN